MTKSEQINELATALAKAQGQMSGAKKDADNPFFKSKYADLAAVVAAIRGPFAEHGLSYTQLPTPCDGEEVAVDTVLMHSSGQWIGSRTVVPVSKKDAQGYGSAFTYARRYGLQAIAGLEAEDDDGNAAASAKPSARAARRPDPPPPPNETPDQKAKRLFPDEPVGGALPPMDEETQRGLLLAQISGCSAKLKQTPADKRSMWDRYIGAGVKAEKADIAALTDLLNELRAVLPEEVNHP
ncbi:MAG TPA: ERF family protein [Gemmatimonadales bacterium]|nr:ERF family protein [Gemmatimonadales bacterium]